MRYFVAAVAAILALLLAGCGSAGQTIHPNPATLYVMSGAFSLFHLDQASTANGIVTPSTVSGPATLLGAVNGMAVDGMANRLFIANQQGAAGSILVFDNTSAKTGNVAPERVVTGSVTALTSDPGPMVLDTSRDLLYVANPTNIVLFSNASTMNGNVAPKSILNVAFVVSGLALDQANDQLFVSSFSTNEVICFDHASQLGITPTGSRVISGPTTGLAQPQALALDKRGRLYVGNVWAGITVYENAGGIAGDVAPIAIIQGNNTQFHSPIHLAIDDNPGGSDSGDLYVQDFLSGTLNAQNIVVFTDIANVNGNVPPSRILTFPGPFGNALALDTMR